MTDRDRTIPFWTPETSVALIPSGVNNSYIVHKDNVLRIVPAANMYIRFTDNPADTATSANILLIANQEYFVSSGPHKFMVADVSTANVIVISQKG